MQIEDGTGKGYQARVSEENLLAVYAVMATLEHHTNHSHGTAYNVLFEQAPTGNDDCIFYMENDDDDDMSVEGITLAISSACEIYIEIKASGTRNAATDLTPANLNAGSGNQAQGVFERGADLAGGAATLSGGVEVERYKPSVNLSSHYNFEQDIILPKGFSLSVWCDTAGISVLGTIAFNYHHRE